MTLKIKFSRKGRKGRPFYHLVLAEARSNRSSCKVKFGHYDPLLSDNKLYISNPEELSKYLKCGAQPTEKVKYMLKKVNFISA